jgi:amidase
VLADPTLNEREALLAERTNAALPQHSTVFNDLRQSEPVAPMTLPLSWEEWSSLDGVALADLVRAGELTAAELAAQAAAGVGKVNPALSGVVELFEDAVSLPGKNDVNLSGPFAGLPFLMKDLGPTMKGRLQEMGSLLMRGNRATADTFFTSKMRIAGLNIIGRTTTPEFGLCSSAENPAVYITRNPWNTDYTTCGSSAGSAAMVAAGVVPLAHATDGGGSIRIPAGVNGNIGLKVSRGVLRHICRI